MAMASTATSAPKRKHLRRISRLSKVPKESQVNGKPPTIEYVDPCSLFVDDSYQRNIGPAGIRLIERMVARWDWTKFKPPVVTKIGDGNYVVVDGQHIATAAASHPNIHEIPIFVVSTKDVREEARAFIGHNRERVGMNTMQIHRARVRSGDDEAMRVEGVLGAGGIELLPDVKSADDAALNTTMAVHTFYWLLRAYGDVKAKAVASALGECQFRPVREQHIKAVAKLLHGDEYAEHIDASKAVKAIRSEPDGKTLGEAKQQAMETGMTAWECLTLIYYRRYQEMFS